MKNSKKLLSVLSTVLMACSITSCNDQPTGLTVCLASEPDTIDPALNSAVDGATLLVHLNSGLYRYQQNASGGLELTYDLAEKIEKKTQKVVDKVIGDDGKVQEVEYPNGTQYTVTLKNDIKWSDGSKITSDDFIYSWNRASGSTLGADYGYMFETIANGLGHETDDSLVPSLAMNKVSDTVFTFDVMVDVPYMDQLLAFPTYQPVQKAAVDTYDTEEDGVWATEAATYVSSGAYILKEWEHDSYIKLVKNENYWDHKNIKMDEITFALSDETEAIFASYESGAYSMIDEVPTDKISELNSRSDYHVVGQMGTYYVSFNVNDNSIFPANATEEQKAEIRTALGKLINKNYICVNIGQAGQEPAYSFVSSGISDADGTEFYKNNEFKKFDSSKADEDYAALVGEAVETLKKYYEYNDTTKKFTNFPSNGVYLYNTSAGHAAIATNIKDTFANYGIGITLKNEDWASFLNTRKEGNYSIARNGWVADYDDPSSYLTMWTTLSGNNDCQFGKGAHASYAGYEADLNVNGLIEANEKGLTWAQSYDKLIDLSNKEADPTKRFKYLHEAEKVLMSTGAICPVYFYTDQYMIKDNVKGFFSSPLGYKFFMYCEIEK